jgi:hypothetical protein
MSAKKRGGKRKGCVTYSDDHLLDLCDQDETMVAFYARTGISPMTIARRFGSFQKYKDRAATHPVHGTGHDTAGSGADPEPQSPPLFGLLVQSSTESEGSAGDSLPKGNRLSTPSTKGQPMKIPTGFEEREKIRVPLPYRAETMKDLIASTGKYLAKELQRFPIKRGLKTRWITTGKMDVRPGGSVTYLISYQERLGFGD